MNYHGDTMETPDKKTAKRDYQSPKLLSSLSLLVRGGILPRAVLLLLVRGQTLSHPQSSEYSVLLFLLLAIFSSVTMIIPSVRRGAVVTTPLGSTSIVAHAVLRRRCSTRTILMIILLLRWWRCCCCCCCCSLLSILIFLIGNYFSHL